MSTEIVRYFPINVTFLNVKEWILRFYLCETKWILYLSYQYDRVDTSEESAFKKYICHFTIDSYSLWRLFWSVSSLHIIYLCLCHTRGIHRRRFAYQTFCDELSWLGCFFLLCQQAQFFQHVINRVAGASCLLATALVTMWCSWPWLLWWLILHLYPLCVGDWYDWYSESVVVFWLLWWWLSMGLLTVIPVSLFGYDRCLWNYPLSIDIIVVVVVVMLIIVCDCHSGCVRVPRNSVTTITHIPTRRISSTGTQTPFLVDCRCHAYTRMPCMCVWEYARLLLGSMLLLVWLSLRWMYCCCYCDSFVIMNILVMMWI